MNFLDVLLALCRPLVHLVHLLLDDAEDWIGLELHWARTASHRLSVMVCRPLLLRSRLLRTWVVVAKRGLLLRVLITGAEHSWGSTFSALRLVGTVKIHGAASDHVRVSQSFVLGGDHSPSSPCEL